MAGGEGKDPMVKRFVLDTLIATLFALSISAGCQEAARADVSWIASYQTYVIEAGDWGDHITNNAVTTGPWWIELKAWTEWNYTPSFYCDENGAPAYTLLQTGSGSSADEFEYESMARLYSYYTPPWIEDHTQCYVCRLKHYNGEGQLVFFWSGISARDL